MIARQLVNKTLKPGVPLKETLKLGVPVKEFIRDISGEGRWVRVGPHYKECSMLGSIHGSFSLKVPSATSASCLCMLRGVELSQRKGVLWLVEARKITLFLQNTTPKLTGGLGWSTGKYHMGTIFPYSLLTTSMQKDKII